jgi:hypothetical protein
MLQPLRHKDCKRFGAKLSTLASNAMPAKSQAVLRS